MPYRIEEEDLLCFNWKCFSHNDKRMMCMADEEVESLTQHSEKCACFSENKDATIPDNLKVLDPDGDTYTFVEVAPDGSNPGHSKWIRRVRWYSCGIGNKVYVLQHRADRNISALRFMYHEGVLRWFPDGQKMLPFMDKHKTFVLEGQNA